MAVTTEQDDQDHGLYDLWSRDPRTGTFHAVNQDGAWGYTACGRGPGLAWLRLTHMDGATSFQDTPWPCCRVCLRSRLRRARQTR